MYELYQHIKKEKGEREPSFPVYSDSFHSTELRFKLPKIDTCKACDMFQMKVKSCNSEGKVVIQQEYENHLDSADYAYKSKGNDKLAAGK
jgi:hypothetical protein